MVIRNTSRYPTAEVRELVKFATSELDMRRVCVNVKNSKHARRGMAYQYIPLESNAPPSCRMLVTIGIGHPDHFPRESGYWNSHARANGEARRGGRWPEITLECWREALVSVAAHEAKHIDQYQHGSRVSELACEHFAAYMLNRYRNERAAPEEAAQPHTQQV